MPPHIQYMPYYYNVPPAAYGAVRAVEPAGGVVMPQQQTIAMVPQNQNGFTDTALSLGESGANFLAAGMKGAAMSTVAKVAAPVALTLSAVNANRAATKEETALIEQFRTEIAQDQHIAPGAVDAKALYAAARHSPVLQEQLNAMQQKIVADPLKMGLNIAAGAVVGAATAGWGLIPMIAAGAGASTVTGYGADALGTQLGVIAPESTAKAALDAIDEARKKGQDVTAGNIFTLFAKSDSELGKLVEARAGSAVDKASPAMLEDVMRHYHPHLHQACGEIAGMINREEMATGKLAFLRPSHFANDDQAALQALKAEIVSSRIPQNMISADSLVYGGKGISYLAANTNRPAIGPFTGRVAAERGDAPAVQSF